MHDRLIRGRIMSQPAARCGVISGMIETAENLARDYDITRAQCDAYAAASHQRATAAWANGVFADEIVPVPVPQKPGDPLMFSHDEGYRPDATAESLATLRPLRSEERRVGKECVSTCRSRWSPYHLKKNHTT